MVEDVSNAGNKAKVSSAIKWLNKINKNCKFNCR